MPIDSGTSSSKPSPWVWILPACTGMALLVAFYFIADLSKAFMYGSGHGERPIISFVGWMLFAFVPYALAVWFMLKREARLAATPEVGRRNRIFGIELGWILVVSFIARALLFTSNPIQEIDYKRYLWDGAVLSNGIDPYRFSPSEVDQSEEELFELDESVYTSAELIDLEKLQALRNSSFEANDTHYWINHPTVRTIYPPLAQIVFVLNHKIAPWSLHGLRFLFLLFEFGTLLLLFDALRRLKLPTHRILIYGWSPLVIKEMVNSPHLDAIVVCCLALSIWSWVVGRYKLLGLALGLGVLAKSFPVVLLPVALVAVYRRKGARPALALIGFFCSAVLAGYLPFLLMGGQHIFDGHQAFATGWTQNESLFAWVRHLTTRLMEFAPLKEAMDSLLVVVGRKRGSIDGDFLARALYGVGMIGFAWTVALWPEGKRSGQSKHSSSESNDGRREERRGDEDLLDVPARWLLITAALFLAAPTGNPWYAAWLLPMLCLVPVRGLLLLTGMLPIYYLSFFTEYHESFYSSVGTNAEVEFYRFQWVEYLPVYALLIWDGVRRITRYPPRM